MCVRRVIHIWVSAALVKATCTEFKPALAAGGPQSLRSRPQNLVELAAGGFPSANYGSTLEGVLQMPFSMGDKADKIGPV